MIHTLFLLMLSGYGFGALMALLGIRGALGRSLVAMGAGIAAAAGIALGAAVMISNSPLMWSMPDLLAIAGGFALRLDSLGAFFLIVIGLGAIPALIYGAGYSAAYEEGRGLTSSRASLRQLGIMLNLFLLTMSLVTFADNVLTFLLMWEGMSLTSYFLVMTESWEDLGELGRAESTVRAGNWYVAMTHAGLVLLLAAFMLLMSGGSGSFSDMRASAGLLDPNLRSLIFVLAFLGFGSKAGLVPMHIWLPRAHPAAPSHVSALMSGVMIKMGVYGVLRVGLDLLGGGPTWWGALALIAGAVSAVLGILYALMENDLKRLPRTALFFLVGAIAISGIPPLNGFVSEWLLFQSLLPGVGFPQPIPAALMMLAVGMLALTSGLAAAGFVKAFGVTFLAMPRSPEAEQAHEAPFSMRVGMALLVSVCVVLGLAPFAVLPMLGQAIAGLDDLPALMPKFSLALSLEMPEGFAQISPTLAALGLLIVSGVVLLLMRILRVNRQRRVSDSWGCGRIGQTPRMEYTSTAFAEPLRRVFAELYRPTKELTIDFNPESKYFVQAIDYKSEIRPWFEEFLYEPLLRQIRRASLRVRQLQFGSLHAYLVYIFIVLMLMLAVLLLPVKI